MSSFQCEQCGASILDGDNGYYTGCDHYPLVNNMINHQRKRRNEKISDEKNTRREKYENRYIAPKLGDLF